MALKQLEQWADDFEAFHERFDDLSHRQEPREQARPSHYRRHRSNNDFPLSPQPPSLRL